MLVPHGAAISTAPGESPWTQIELADDGDVRAVDEAVSCPVRTMRTIRSATSCGIVQQRSRL